MTKTDLFRNNKKKDSVAKPKDKQPCKGDRIQFV